MLLLLSPGAPAQASNVVVGDGIHPSSCNMFGLGAMERQPDDSDLVPGLWLSLIRR